MKQLSLALVALLVVAGCAAKPELLSRPGGNPAGVDFTGTWVLKGRADVPPVGEQGIDVSRATSRSVDTNRQRQRPQQRSRGSAVHVFLESGRRLKISQTVHGLFISFDRAVVEEYRFGENRTISVGPIEAQRVSGWVGETLLVETLDEDGYLLTESWQLEADGNLLKRDVTINKGDKQTLALQQVFERD